MSYAPNARDAKPFVGGTAATPTSLVDARILFYNEFVFRYSGPARGFDIPIALAPVVQES